MVDAKMLCDGGREQSWAALAGLRDEAVRIVRGRIPRPEDAEDHVQEAIVRLAQHTALDTDSGRLRALLVRAACCIAIDRHRHTTRQRHLLPRLLSLAGVRSAEDIVADRSEAQWLAAGLDDLGSMERDALLHAVRGHRPGEIAELLGVDYKSAENALGRARRKLRLRAAGVALGLAGLLRRLRLEEHSTVLATSALAAVLLLQPGGGRAAAAASHQPAAPVQQLQPSHLVLVASHPAAVLPVVAPAPHVAGHSAEARSAAQGPPAVAPAPPPPDQPPGTLPPPPWKGSPGYQGGGSRRIIIPGGTPAGWVMWCALTATWHLGTGQIC